MCGRVVEFEARLGTASSYTGREYNDAAGHCGYTAGRRGRIWKWQGANALKVDGVDYVQPVGEPLAGGQNQDDCKLLCDRTPGCAGFIWRTPQEDCLQVRNIPEGAISRADGRSGHRCYWASSSSSSNNLPAQVYTFRPMAVPAGSSGKFSDLMVSECAAQGMKPVCDGPGCEVGNTKGLWLGNGYTADSSKPWLMPEGFSDVSEHWTDVCGYCGDTDCSEGMQVRCAGERVPAAPTRGNSPAIATLDADDARFEHV